MFWPVAGYDFVNFDDDAYVTRNEHVKAGLTLAGAGWALQPTEVAFWRPVTWLSHMADVQLFGLKAGPHHLVNVILHALNAALLLQVLAGLTGSFGRSAVVAALFAFHPLNIEPVAWIAERKEVLATFFGLSTLLAYRRYVGGQRLGRYLTVVVLFVLGLMSKATLVTLPLLLLLVDVWPLGRAAGVMSKCEGVGARLSVLRPLLLEKAPLFLLSLCSGAITYFTVQRLGGVQTLHAVPLGSRLLQIPLSYLSYLEKILWPSRLAIFYPLPQRPPAWSAALAAALILIVLTSVVVLARRRPWLPVGWAWFVIGLVPMIGLVQAGLQVMADRYVYVPAIGVFIALTWGLGDLAGAVAGRRRIAAVAAAAAVLAAVAATRVHLPVWKDSVTLFSSALANTADNWLAHSSLGLALTDRGRYAEAREQFTEALTIVPDLPPALYGMGVALAREGRLAEAEGWYRRALTVTPDHPGVWYSLGMALLGQGRTAEGANALEAAVQRAPDHVDAHYNLAVALTSLGEVEKAVSHYREAVRLRPDDLEARYNLGIALESRGARREAEEQLRAAARLRAERDAGSAGRP